MEKKNDVLVLVRLGLVDRTTTNERVGWCCGTNDDAWEHDPKISKAAKTAQKASLMIPL